MIFCISYLHYPVEAADVYPKKIQFDQSRAETCENKGLVKQGYFWIVRQYKGDKEWSFYARLQEIWTPETQNIAHLIAKEGGSCKDIETNKGSRRCGLAKSLSKMCFTDDMITRNGGYTPTQWADLNLARKI